MKKVTAKIEKDSYGRGLWIITEHEDNEFENTRIPISEDEVLPIHDAINDWMIKESQKDRGTTK